MSSTLPDSVDRLVESRLLRARQMLFDQHHNYGYQARQYVLADVDTNMRFRANNEVVAITAKANPDTLYYNSHTLSEWSDEELVFAWAHVACKRAMGFNWHYLTNPKDRNRRALNMAIDLLVNATIEQLELGTRPGNALWDDRIYPELTLDQVYDFVMEQYGESAHA